MARARNIKPGFFTNDVLAECSPFARLLFIGLWTLADREGRVEHRTSRIKAQVLPYDSIELEPCFSELAERGFIVLYEVAGSKYIQVTNFRKHQNPHVKEGASTIPAPCQSGACTGNSGTDPADSLLLIPSSTTDSPSPEVPEPDSAAAVDFLIAEKAEAGVAKGAVDKALAFGVTPSQVWQIIDFWKQHRGWGIGALINRIRNATPRSESCKGWPEANRNGTPPPKSAEQIADDRHYAAINILRPLRGKSDEEKTAALQAAGYKWSDLK